MTGSVDCNVIPTVILAPRRRYYIRVGPHICNQHMNPTFRVELAYEHDQGIGRHLGA